MRDILVEFKAFLLRGNVVDLAIAVIIGVAFGAVVTSLVEDVITPFIAAIGGKPDFSDVAFNVGDGRIAIGSFLNALITFVVIAAVVFFLVVRPINWMMARRKREEAAGTVEPPEDVLLLREIRDLLARRQ
jgi:large conductance mechanosensitive channel